MNNSLNILPKKLKKFLLDLEDIKITQKISAKYNLNLEDSLNLGVLIFKLLIKDENLEEASLDELLKKYNLNNLEEEIKTYLKKDIILEVVPLVNKLWEEEKTEEEPYEEREKRYLEMMKTIVEKPLLKEETKEEIPEAQLEKETKEEIPSIPFTISWKPESEEVVEIKEEKEKPSEGSEMIQIEFKKEEEKKDEEAIDLSQI